MQDLPKAQNTVWNLCRMYLGSYWIWNSQPQSQSQCWADLCSAAPGEVGSFENRFDNSIAILPGLFQGQDTGDSAHEHGVVGKDLKIDNYQEVGGSIKHYPP